MEWHDIEVDGYHTVKFTDLSYVPLTSPPEILDIDELSDGRKLGGILRHGEWAWLAKNSVLQIVSVRNGQTISSYEFCESHGYEKCHIKFVEELFPSNPGIMLLAVVLESFRATGGGCSYVAFYSVELSSVLSTVELTLHLTCTRFMDSTACRRSLLQNFDGCLAVGSEEGVIALLDINLRKLKSIHKESQNDTFVPCHIVDYSLPLTEIHRTFRQCQRDGEHFGLLMEVIESPCAIQCMLPIDLILGLAIGLEDGRLALYDLAELQIFYVALPYPEVAMSALVKMDFLEPPDDPKPCLFIWTLHENGENLHAVLHSLMYEKRILESDGTLKYFESFQAASVRLQLPLEATRSKALACQAISTLPIHGEDDSNCLCAISWLSVLEGKNKLLIFDLNQWYKEEMPYVLQYGKQPNYLAGYILNGEYTGLNTLLNPNKIAHFNSMQRFEEHFYPNSLSFEALLLHTEGCRCYNWEGAQNRVINLLRSSNAAIFLEPNLYFNEIIRTRLMPQFIELNINSTFSRNAKYEVLLSSALEHNCVSLLRDCAKSWIDGSFMGNFSVSTGLSLSTLTDWIWKRATCIKSRCNDLCKNLFEFDGYPLDNREQKELGFITRQLKLLSDLLQEILVYAKKQIPERVFNDLENKHSSLSMAYSYQNVLLWLLNIGLLPEASPYNDKINANNGLIPYPYNELKKYYRNKRSFFAQRNETFISKKSGNCKLLFIDAFIEHVCKGNILHEYWLENEGNGLYPPNSLEAMLRIMLVPGLSYDDKYAILLYFFLDLNMAIDEDVYKDVVANFIKFPSVFKLSAPLIKTVQAFWNLDHDHYLPAVNEFISPFNKNQCYPQWQVELLIEVLLNQKASNLALRVLESQPYLISPLLKLQTLLANELISDAFHFVRSKNDDALFQRFFTCCLNNSKFGVIRDLALSEREGQILQNILKRSKSPGAESLHFVYLLQKSKYIEAVSYMEELSNKAKGIKNPLHQASQMDTPNMVLSAFNTTMAPVTQGLTDVYFRIKNKIKKKEVDNKSPVPLSCQLIKQNANGLLGGIYHSSALSAHFATYYWGEMEEQTKQTKYILNSNNVPFLRKPQIDTNSIDYLAKNNISYPQVYKAVEKRTLIESGVLDNEHDEFQHKFNPKKKRRLRGQEIVDDLSNFMKMNKTSNSLNASEFTFGPEQTNEQEHMRKSSLDLFSRPLITKSVGRDKIVDSVPTAVPELHGILKTHTPDPDQQQREPIAEEEKNLRFRLPSVDVSTTQTQQEVTQSEEASEATRIAPEEKLVDEIKSDLLTGTPKLKQVTRSVSEDSNSSSNVSEENFYSPLSSQNNSKLNSSNLSSYSFLSGPQPRKPLARLSAERSEKSMTPELEIKTTQSSSSLTSGSTIFATALETALTSEISPKSSLERLDSDRFKTTATSDKLKSKETSDTAYITTTETSSNIMTYSSFNIKTETTQTTSGFGSIVSHSTFAGSKINEFLPKESSSKVGTTPIKIMGESLPPTAAKLSECSTVLGSLTTLDCTESNITNIPSNKTKLDLDKPTEEEKRQMLETTLSMSTYEFSTLDSTLSLQQTKSTLMVTAKDVTFKFASDKDSQNKTAEKEKEKAEIECGKENEENIDGEKQDIVIDIQKELHFPDRGGKSDFDCIVLSSSSSSQSSQEQEEDNNSPVYSDYEMDGEIEDEENYEFEESNEIDTSNEEIDHADNIEDDENYNHGQSNEIDMFNEEIEEDENYDLQEINDEDIDDQSDILDYNNYDSEESNECDVSNENDKDDYGEDDDNQEELRNKDIEDVDIIQLIEDSLSETDSDDVKLVEDVQPNLADTNLQMPVSEESKQEIATSIFVEKKEDAEDLKAEEQTDVRIIAAPINQSPSMQENQLKQESVNTATSQEILYVTLNKPLDVNIEIDENVVTSKDNKAEDLIEDVSKNVSIETEPKSTKEIKSLDSFKEIEVIEIAKAELEEGMKDTIYASEEKIETQIEIKFTTGKGATDTDSTKSEEILATETISENKEKVDELKRDKETSAVLPIQKKPDDNKSINQKNQEKEANEEKELKVKAVEIRSISQENEADKVQTKSELIIGKKNENEAGKNAKQEVKSMENESSSPIKNSELQSISQESAKDKVVQKVELSIEKYKISEKHVLEVDPSENESAHISIQSKPRILRGSSVPPLDVELSSSPRRNASQIILESQEASNLTPRTRRSVRATSLQPKFKHEELEAVTPQKVQKIQEPECSETRAARGTSLPPGVLDGKISTRRRSTVLDAISEDPITLDSPSTRTRSRLRLNSAESDLESPLVGTSGQLVQQKRTRRTSTEVLLTPKRMRHDSISSQPESCASVTTPRSLRGRSILSTQEEDAESIPASPKPGNNKNIELKRKKGAREEHKSESKEQIDRTSPRGDQSAESEVSYSSSRRLTRTQLAIMEKSTALTQALIKDAVAKEAISPPPNKRRTKSRSSRSSNVNADSDDAESVSSKHSAASSVTGTKRRVTRSSVKEKDDVEDDGASIASSLGSEKHQRKHRSKDKSSPNSTLATIPEDAPIETKKRGRPNKN